ncbi:digestive organ expansion factor-like protein [Trifolium pratense]|uniref:Digestive organ expansion factor-like protein n=1 Tax=Trifolium pratense TaxID=57577 RepID=A0A2K3L8B1_TRIPR|nr:uncharacterized protein LOC123909584 [Trifolium pratense]PNX74769.1 digestive organ expansion factor-like protein [Trifolium pratense]
MRERRLTSPPPRKKMKSKEETSWESIRHEELMESDLSIYDDLDFPFYIGYTKFTYRNKAQKKKDDEIEVAMAHYRDRSRNLSVFDAIGAPSIARLCGGTRPLHIDDDDRLELAPLCKLALDKYNAENQGANFVFVDLVKSTRSACAGSMYNMTFQAKDDTHPFNSPHIIFRARVWKRVPGAGPPEVKSCAMKAT